MERALFRPWGMAGGGPGVPASITVERQDEAPQLLGRVDMLTLRAGDRVTIRTAGAGGYGDPYRRDPPLVLDDVRRGLLGADAALRDYGVVVRDGAADEAATSARRAELRETVASAGPERAAWDEVFAPALLDRLAAAQAPLSVAQRQAARSALYAQVLALLPAGFPRAAAEPETRAAARMQLESGIAAFERAAEGDQA
jgi:N-methylhydantoinase B